MEKIFLVQVASEIFSTPPPPPRRTRRGTPGASVAEVKSRLAEPVSVVALRVKSFASAVPSLLMTVLTSFRLGVVSSFVIA
jgi:hypothetical protein